MSPPDLGNMDFGEGLLMTVVVVAAVLILVPIFFFGIELIVVGCLLAVALVGRVFLGQPWVIEAKAEDPLAPGRVLEWQVSGWRNSNALIRQVVADIAAGREPTHRLLPQEPA